MVYSLDNDEVALKMCTYYDVIAPDTISYGEPYSVTVRCYIGNFKDFSVKLSLGNVESDFNLTNKSKEWKSDSTELNFTVQNYLTGINLLTGHLTYFENGNDITSKFRISEFESPLIFYKQFVVLPNE